MAPSSPGYSYRAGAPPRRQGLGPDARSGTRRAADPQTSAAAARALRRRHETVRGVSDEGVPYAANDPALLLWVWATLVETAILIHTRLIEPLGWAERSRYYEEQKHVAVLCGVPEGGCPATYEDFLLYYDDVVERELRATAVGHAVWRTIKRPRPLPRPLAPLLAASALTTLGLLPPSVRERFGWDWSPRQERVLGVWLAACRRAIPLLPDPVRFFPEARRAERRIERSAAA